MSNPQNPLAKFRSYSYHHILIACDNEKAAEYIESNPPLTAFGSLGNDLPVFAEKTDTQQDNITQATATDGDSTTTTTTTEEDRIRIGNYVVILNGLIDTRYVIQEASWFTATSASTDENDRFNSIAVEGKMVVQEPGGAVFMNALNNAADKLRTDPTGIIWILKTIFVGHGVDSSGNEITDTFANIQPLRFIIYNVTGSFDTGGGNYIIEFAGASNGAARFPMFSRAAERITLTPSSTNLGQTLDEFAERMTKYSSDNRDCVVNMLNSVYTFPPYNPDSTNNGTLDELRGVQYSISLDEHYKNNEYEITGWDCRQMDKQNEAGRGAFKFGASCTVEQAIRHIMERCERVLKDRTEGDEDGTKYIYKILSKISMVGKDDPNSRKIDEDANYNTVAVQYFIRRYAQPTNQTIERVLSRQSQSADDQSITQELINENTVEFDYFFSGKNTDILDFDLKMEMGLSFLQTLATSNTLPTQAEQISAGVTRNTIITNTSENRQSDGNDGNDERPPKVFIRNRTPIFPATQVKDVLLKNAGNPKDTALFNAYLSRQAALESVEAQITIAGNPYLMGQMNKPAGEIAKRNTIGSDNEAKAQNVLRHWDTLPALAKVNIYMPIGDAAPSTTGNFERIQFWYNGYYYIYGIEHKFSDGMFTQDLQMLALPSESLIDEQRKQEMTECGVNRIAETDENKKTGTEETEAPATSDEAVKASTRTNKSEVQDCGNHNTGNT